MRQMARQRRTLMNKLEAGFVVKDADLGSWIYTYENERVGGWFSV
jgi:hypothetical protein